MSEVPSNKFRMGDKVGKQVGYDFPGIIVSVFWTTTGQLRYVVEMEQYHLLHIFNESQLKFREE